jgi:hypothetical protein
VSGPDGQAGLTGGFVIIALASVGASSVSTRIQGNCNAAAASKLRSELDPLDARAEDVEGIETEVVDSD